MKKNFSCLVGDGGGDGGGLGGKKSLSLLLLLLLLLLSLVLLLLLLLFLLFELKDVGFSFNAFNLLCILISIPFGAFLSVYLQHLFYLYQVQVKANRQQDFVHQKYKCLEIQIQACFACRNNFLLTGSSFCLKFTLFNLSCITYKLMLSCIPFAKWLVANGYFWISVEGIPASLAILPQKFSFT